MAAGGLSPLRASIDDAPWLRPYGALIDAVGRPDGDGDWLGRLSALAAARGLVSGGGLPLRFVDHDGVDAPAYEAHVFDTGAVPTRTRGDGAWHDWFNALVWLALPSAKARLNAIQAAAIRAQGIGPRRGGTRDAATLFDENAVLVIGEDAAAVDALRRFDWRALFVERRAAFAHALTVLTFGHALMHKLCAPYKAICGHAWIVAMPAPAPDALVAGSAAMDTLDQRLAQSLQSPPEPAGFTPLPVLGVPGWWPANADPAFYNDPMVFRAGRRTHSKETL